MHKIVPEHINEVSNLMKSVEYTNKYSKNYDIKIIAFWLNKMEIDDYIIKDDYSINVFECVNLSNKNLVEFPEYIQFNKIEGYFDCSKNNLTSLRGCPKVVRGTFCCHKNQLTNLEYCPTYVGGNFYCYKNKKQFFTEDIKKYCNVKGFIET